MTDRNLIRIQALSGATFAVFALLHLLNTALAVGGAETYNAFQRDARAIYQQPAIEVALVGLPLLVHFIAAIARLRRHGFRRTDVDLRARLHRITGYFLLLVIAGHVLAVRGSSLAFGVFPGFEGLSFSLAWMPLAFYPYYLLFALCGLYHVSHGLLVALDAFGVGAPASLRRGPLFWVLQAAAASVLVAGVLAMGGVTGEIADPGDNDYARLMHELTGATLGN